MVCLRAGGDLWEKAHFGIVDVAFKVIIRKVLVPFITSLFIFSCWVGSSKSPTYQVSYLCNKDQLEECGRYGDIVFSSFFPLSP